MEPQVHQTIGIITPDGGMTTTSIITNAASGVAQQSKNLVMDHVYGMATSPASMASSASFVHASPSPSNSNLRGRSKVWNEFTVTADGKKVACHRCGDYLAYSNSHSTSSMLKHLKRKHNLDLYPPVNGNGNDDGDSNGGAGGSSSSIAHTDTKFKPPAAASSSFNTNSFDKRTRPAGNKPGKKFIPKDAEEIDTSIQHGPLLFKDPCVRMKWTDHSDTFLRTFSSLYSDESYTDVTLVVEQQFFKAHRVILSSASEFFDESFRMTPAGQHPIIFLKDVKAMDFRILLDFIYKGEVSIPPSLIPGLVKVGSDLRVRGLSDFVWNEQLASSVFQPKPQQQQPQPTTQPAQNISENRRFIQQVQSHQTMIPQQQLLTNNIASASSQVSPLKVATPIRTLIRQPIQQQMATTHQQGGISQTPKMYSRIVNIRPTNPSVVGGVNGGVPGGVVSSNGFQGQIITGDLGAVCSSVANTFPSMKRIRIVTNEPRLSPQIRQVRGANELGGTGGDAVVNNESLIPQTTTAPAPETVLMVTNEGETLLSTTQGGVTVLAQPNSSMTIPLDQQEMQSDSQQVMDQHQLRPVITAVTSQAHQHQVSSNANDGGTIGQQELDEVVYSIAEIADDGGGDDDVHEVLMNQDQEMVCDERQEDSVDKKPF